MTEQPIGSRGGRPPVEIDPSRRMDSSVSPNAPASIPGMKPGAQAVATSGDLVYWGYNSKTKQQQFIDKAQARNAWPLLPDATRQKLTDRMDAAFGKGKWTNGKLQYYWDQALNGGNFALYAQNRLLAIPDVFDIVVGQGAAQEAARGGGSGGGSSTSRQIRLTDPQGARTLIDNALESYLGRRATTDEQQQFLKALNVQEQRNPTVTRTTSGGGATTSVTTGGFNPSTFAEDYAQGMEGAAEFQAATTYLDAFINALRPVVQ